MDELSEKLDALFGSPEGMDRIRNAMEAFGLDGASESSPPPDGDAAALQKLLPLIGKLGEEDDSTALLSALRPYVSEEREERLDNSIRFMKLRRLLPLLKDMSL